MTTSYVVDEWMHVWANGAIRGLGVAERVEGLSHSRRVNANAAKECFIHSLTLSTHQLSDRAGQRRVRLLRVLVALRRAGRQVRRARLHRLHGEAPSAPAFISSDLSVYSPDGTYVALVSTSQHLQRRAGCSLYALTWARIPVAGAALPIVLKHVFVSCCFYSFCIF